MILIELSKINNNQLFYAGTKLRKYSVGLNVKDISADYYDYILAYTLWDSKSMMLVNITEGVGKNKAGSVYGGVLPVKLEHGIAVVDKSSFHHTLGDDLKNWYIINP